MRCWPYLLAGKTPRLFGRTIGVEDPFSAGRKFSERLAHTQGPLDEIASAIWTQTFRESRNTRRAKGALERTDHGLVGRSEIDIATLATRPHLKHSSSLRLRMGQSFHITFPGVKQLPPSAKNKTHHAVGSRFWRRRRDLNPRSPYEDSTLAGWCTRPNYATSPRTSTACTTHKSIPARFGSQDAGRNSSFGAG